MAEAEPQNPQPLFGAMVAMGWMEFEASLPASFLTPRPWRSILDRSFFLSGVDLQVYGFRICATELQPEMRNRRTKALKICFLNLHDEPINVSGKIRVRIFFPSFF